MRLSTYSDYSVRVLMQAALRQPGRVTVDEVASTYGISRHHLVKVVHDLAKQGYLATRQGAGGGFTLATPAEQIGLGEIVRLGEESETVIDCLDKAGCACRLLPSCRLKVALDEAAAAFFAVLDGYTLADLIRQPTRLRAVLGL
ncbi:MAG: Rrf2 family transcriptional regulator [Opitutaceae bacterium]|nr:Rrf2 family transcriptional regulator [Opitutaceae bacterium]